MNTAEFLEISTSILPKRDALICGDQRRTFEEMRSEAMSVAVALQKFGIVRGDHVGVMSVNSLEYVVIYYACARIGAVFVPLNYRAKQNELSYMLNIAEVKILFISDRYQESVSKIRDEIKSVKHFVALENPVEGQISFDALIESDSDALLHVEVEDSDPTIIIFTSGTTAMPKGVVVTFQDMTVYVTNTMSPADPTTDHDKTLLSVPIFHIAGITAIISAIWGGRTLVILPQFTPSGWMEAVDSHGVTHSMVVPTMLKRIMDHEDFSKFKGDSLKLIAYGAAPMPYEIVRKAIEQFECALMNAYGQTESTSSISFLGPEDHILSGTPAERSKTEQRLRSVGKIMDDVDVAIRSPDDLNLDFGEEGEICVRSARIMQGYYKQEEETSQAIQDGWLHTGDTGYLDEDGYLFITGRTKDLIIRGGENISPGEIEQVLEDHPKITEAVVIGVPNVEWGEVIKAIVVLAAGESLTFNEMISHMKSRLPSHKIPEYLTIVKEITHNHMGKTLKNELRRLHGDANNK